MLRGVSEARPAVNPPSEPAGVVASVSELVALGGPVRQRRLDFTAGARSILAGAHLSRFRGRGMDFSESREYAPGDDVRHIDWRVTARTGKTHTKLYTEERERPVFVVADFNPGMYFGTRGALKSVTASRVAACVAWSVVQGGDRIGAVLSIPEDIRELRPAGGRRGALNLISSLHECTQNHRGRATATASEPLAAALQQAARVVHPGSLIIVISDFYEHGSQVRQLLSKLSGHNDLVACQVLDAIECQAPSPGQYLITDGDTRQVLDTRGRGASGRYQRMVRDRDEGLQRLLNGFDMPLVRVLGHESMLDPLTRAFGPRNGRTGR